MEAAKTRNSSMKDVHSHHIIPRCIGGKDSPDNLVNLTFREHFVAHLLLAKIYGGKLWHAVKMMGAVHGYTGRMYAVAKKKHSSMLSIQNQKKRKPKETRHYKCYECDKEIIRIEFVHRPSKERYFCSIKCRNKFCAKNRPSRKGTSLSHIPKRTAWNKGKSSPMKGRSIKGHPAWNKGVHNPLGSINGKKGADKLSKTAKGRKKQYREDGSWTWVYPNRNTGDQSPQ